jgi:hypothetical protein
VPTERPKRIKKTSKPENCSRDGQGSTSAAPLSQKDHDELLAEN